MLFFARVVDNRNFGQTGTIEVFLPQKSSENGFESELQKDLKNNYTSIQEVIPGFDTNSPNFKLTYSCLVVSPMGNGYNTGEFSVPQINTIGLVMEIENKRVWSSYRYVWLGGLYGSKIYGNDIFLPRDDTDDDSFDFEDTALKSVNKEDEVQDDITGNDILTTGEYIIKTKTSGVTDYDNVSEDMIDLEQIPSDNTFVMNKNKIALRHNEYTDKTKKIGISDIKMNKDAIEIKRLSGDSDDKRKEQRIKISEDAIVIEFDNKTDSKKVSISFDKEGNTVLETTGNVEFHSEGDMSFKTDKKLSLYSKSDLSINSDAVTKMVSKRQVKIEGNGVDMGKQLVNMSQHYMTTQTSGSPTNHALAPGSVKNGNDDLQQSMKGFIL